MFLIIDVNDISSEMNERRIVFPGILTDKYVKKSVKRTTTMPEKKMKTIKTNFNFYFVFEEKNVANLKRLLYSNKYLFEVFNTSDG